MELYLKKLFKLNEYMSNLENLMKNSIDYINQKKEYYIINKDIISRHIDSDIYKKVEDYKIKNNNLFTNIDDLVKDFMIKYKIKSEDTEGIIKDDDIIKPFFYPDYLRIKYVEYPTNFFIIDKDIADLFPGIYLINYKTLIGKEGIFILKSGKDEEEDEKLFIYFIKSLKKLDLDNFRINKIYIYNDEEKFLNEFNTNMKGKEADSYFASRNFAKKGGFYTVIDDGKKIGLYININRREIFEYNEYEIDENRQYIEQFG